jgi:hypothetical protein
MELDDRGTWIRFPEGARDVSLLQGVKTGFGTHTISSKIGSGVFTGRKAAGA